MMPLKSKLILSLVAFAALSLGSASTAKADLVVMVGGGGTGSNVQFNDNLNPNNGNTTTLQALTNTNVLVGFSSTGNILANGGQASISGGTGNTNFNNLTITASTGNRLNQVIFNVNPPNGTPGTVSFTGTLREANGTTITQTFSTTFPIGNGSNFFIGTTINGEQLLSLTINSSIGLTDIRQIRIDSGPLALTAAAVPEPATMMLLGTGLAGLAGAVRRRRNGATAE